MAEKTIVYKIKNEEGKFYSGVRFDYAKKKDRVTFGEKGKPVETIDWAISIISQAKKSGMDTSQWVIEPHVRKAAHTWDVATSNKFYDFLKTVNKETSGRISSYLEEVFLFGDFDFPHMVVIGHSGDKKEALDVAIKGIKKDNVKRKTWNGYETLVRFKTMKDLLKFRVAFEPRCLIIEDIREVLS